MRGKFEGYHPNMRLTFENTHKLVNADLGKAELTIPPPVILEEPNICPLPVAKGFAIKEFNYSAKDLRSCHVSMVQIFNNIHHLKEREQFVLTHILGIMTRPKTYKEVAIMLDRSQSVAQQSFRKGLRKIGHHLALREQELNGLYLKSLSH